MYPKSSVRARFVERTEFMPWVNAELCVGCAVCVEECPVGAISMVEETAQINDEECIRCGRCHDACPSEAVRHDGERIPQEIEANLAWAGQLLKHFKTPEEKTALVERLKRYFSKQKKVAEQTIQRLESLGGTL